MTNKLRITDIVVKRIEGGRKLPPKALRTIIEDRTISREDKTKIVEACEKNGLHSSAAKIYVELGMREKARECAEAYEKDGLNSGAAKIYLELGMKEKAAEADEKDGQYGKAAKLYLELGMREKAAEMQILQGNFAEATAILETMEAVN